MRNKEDTVKPIYEIDFPALSLKEKVDFITDLQENIEACLADKPIEVQRLADTLIFTRWWNSYKHIAPEEPTPEILGTAIELLWDFLEGKCGDREFGRFKKSFYEAARVAVFSFMDEDSLKKDPESEAFYQAHFSQWESESYNNFCIWLATMMQDIDRSDGYPLGWEDVGCVLYEDIAMNMIDFLDTVCLDDLDNFDGHPLAKLKRRERGIYRTSTFAQVIALLQQDLRTALSGTPLAELRERYRNEYLFSPEESAKISRCR
ncbi:hypothetical protein D1641_05645 [Colidextribacter sp. OB.20]|nr:hypothetical protein [Colidextribacter sp. OB.20]